MSEQLTVAPAHEPEDDLDLIIAYLNQALDPDRVALVRQRLEEDPAFRDLAAPLLLAWSVPPRWKTEPMPRGELEKRWDEFTRRAGFIHQRRRARRRRLELLGVLLLVLGTGSWLARDTLGAWWRAQRQFTTLTRAGEWVAIAHDVDARLEPGARLRVRRVPGDGDGDADVVRLQGSAEFRVRRPRWDERQPARPLIVETRAGGVVTLRGSVAIAEAGDTVTVAVRAPEAEERVGAFRVPTVAHLVNAQGDAVLLRELQRGRLVKHTTPEILP